MIKLKNAAHKKWLLCLLIMILLALGAIFGSKETGVASSRLAVHFPRVMRKMDMLACTFDEYRKGRIPRCSAALQA